MTETKKTDSELSRVTDPILSASALGFAMAAQAVEFWFGVASGVARAGQDILEREKKNGIPPFAPGVKSGTESAKAAARTVVAEVERATKDVVEAAAKLATPTAAPKPAEPKAKAAAQGDAPSNVTPLRAPSAKPAATAAKEPPKAKSAKAKAKTAKPAEALAASAASTPATQAAAHPAAPSIMPEDFRAPKSIARPDQPDDLKLLPGVGPKLEQVLNSLGVWTYAQVSAWEPEEIAYVEDLTGLDGRVTADKWLEEAGRLAKGEEKH